MREAKKNNFSPIHHFLSLSNFISLLRCQKLQEFAQVFSSRWQSHHFFISIKEKES
jgi:hypothetical protein